MLANIIRGKALLYDSPIHGLTHWNTVLRNGLYLCGHTGANKRVVSYFAFFHDSMRIDEGEDPGHGLRGAEFAKENRHFLDLTNDEFSTMYKACAGHTGGRRPANETIATCWDADRLDLGRVGIDPDPKYLFTKEAKRIAETKDFKVLAGNGMATNI